MNLPRHEFFAGAVLARDEHPAIGRRRHRDLLAQFTHRAALADHRVAAIDARAQGAILGLEPALPQRVAHRQHRLLERQRLLDEIERPQLRGLDGRLDVGVARDHDDLRVHVTIAKPFQRHEAVDSWQPDVEQDHLVRPPADLIETRLTAVDGVHRVPFVAQDAAERCPHARFVVNDQDG